MTSTGALRAGEQEGDLSTDKLYLEAERHAIDVREDPKTQSGKAGGMMFGFFDEPTDSVQEAKDSAVSGHSSQAHDSESMKVDQTVLGQGGEEHRQYQEDDEDDQDRFELPSLQIIMMHAFCFRRDTCVCVALLTQG